MTSLLCGGTLRAAMWQKEFVEALKTHFSQQKKSNPRYSLRAYAKKVGLSPGALSEILSGKRKWNLSAERAAAVLERLSLDRRRKNRLLVLLGLRPDLARKPLPEKDYDTLLDWVFFPVLVAFDLGEEHRSPEVLARKLGLPRSRVEQVLVNLVEKGLLEKTPSGSLRKAQSSLETSDGIPSSVIQRHHEMNLDFSRKALKDIPAGSRDFTAMTFAGSRKRLDLLRQEIRKLYTRAAVLAEDETGNDEVFHLSVHLFPTDFSVSQGKELA